MRSTVEPLEGNKVKLSVEVDEDEFEQAVDAAFKKIAREVRIPGFRPGKAPRKVLEARIGPRPAGSRRSRTRCPSTTPQAVIEHDVDVIAPAGDRHHRRPGGRRSCSSTPSSRSAPRSRCRGYGSLSVTLERPGVDEEALAAQIDRLREHGRPRWPTSSARPQDGDIVTIDIAGTQDGEAQSGLTADDYSYEVGAAAIVPEVDEQLVGAKVGDILEFAATHPDPDEDAVAHFRVLVKEVKEKVLPELTDEWATEASEFETLDELRDEPGRPHDPGAQGAGARWRCGRRSARRWPTLVTEDAPRGRWSPTRCRTASRTSPCGSRPRACASSSTSR